MGTPIKEQQWTPGTPETLLQTDGHTVVKIPLPLPLPGLSVVNTYVIATGDEVTLIDPGWADEDSEATLVGALRSLGRTPSDICRILVTHAHWDHYTQALKWRDELGIEVMLGAEERHTIEAFDARHGPHRNFVPALLRAGASQLARDISALQWEPYERDMPFGAPDRWLRDGDVIDAGGVTITARATPGHTRGHMVFESSGLAFTGDHLLPRITPSIAFERVPERLPLRSFLRSLQLFLDLPDYRMLPAHGESDNFTRQRAQELLDHHDIRLRAVTGLVAAGATTAFEVAGRMRWTRHDRTITELDPVHQMTAVLEVQAHLDLLEFLGVLHIDDSSDVSAFTLS